MNTHNDINGYFVACIKKDDRDGLKPIEDMGITMLRYHEDHHGKSIRGEINDLVRSASPAFFDYVLKSKTLFPDFVQTPKAKAETFLRMMNFKRSDLVSGFCKNGGFVEWDNKTVESVLGSLTTYKRYEDLDETGRAMISDLIDALTPFKEALKDTRTSQNMFVLALMTRNVDTISRLIVKAPLHRDVFEGVGQNATLRTVFNDLGTHETRLDILFNLRAAHIDFRHLDEKKGVCLCLHPEPPEVRYIERHPTNYYRYDC